MNVSERDLRRLREIITRFYGEDIAQDTMVRILSRKYREHWFKRELFIAKRKWQQSEKRNNLSEPYPTEAWQEDNREECYSQTSEGHTDSCIDLALLCARDKDVSRLVELEFGRKPFCRVRKAQLRQAIRLKRYERG